MKKCPTCNNENADSMRFCLQCGTPLPDAPMVVDLGGGQGGNTMETKVSNRGNFQQQNFQQPSSGFQNPPNFSNVPPAAPKKSKTWLIVGGIAALFFLIFSAGAAVVGYNMLIKPSPTPNPSPTASTSPSSSASTSPSKSPTKSPTETPDETPTPRTNDGKMSGSLQRMWIDYNVTEGGEKGMMIHVSYKVTGMKGVPSYLALYFSKENGEKLKSDTTGFKSADGQLALYKEMDPGFDPAVYEDTQLFLPYDEIDLPPGKYNLEISADIIYKEGGLIKHLKDHPFVFEYK